ncbi:alpha-beta hydrolase superfamily lysophospholipase [Arthrobacter sp. PvP102]|jgi:alpha-beta hydrolase superfamily lysophospholipase|uniref:alpha/beta hydrolase n=1 Tax=unclassified Arthrobacter TaxID=235627 RepID=UPI0000527D17|nr:MULTISPECIES: alpha/beta hydrolase [unclassified Arthrobacter]ABK03602.1 putative lysophospholipase [Arthrobacter sp. FB24]MBP1231517.1 alpha-beta hydrolase superfamily lysophospholipase [Arthrobacter sp. PvP103]MBP1236652.1 alpha-beta hydrolase superfamily lysophospholipase [Arthrobacter sp. PvP102]
MEWHTDILGDDFQACSYQATGGDGVERTATLVRHVPQGDAGGPGGSGPRPLPRRAILFLHGWSDYFFNVELAQFWTGKGFEFFALDMHNHGRSLQADTHGGYVADLDDYDAEISKAIEIIGSLWPEQAGKPPLTLMGHSTGGLIAALWVSRHPGVASQLVLNSPWLEMHGSSLVRRAARSMVGPLARYRPEAVLRLPERGFYWRSISSEAEGEWTLDNKYRPPLAFPVRAGWLSAVLAGHSRVARGLRIDIPILVLLSGASANGMFWTEAMRRTDAVLDVNTIAIRAMALGRTVTLERIDGALHDVFLSPPHVRADAYARLTRWIRGYVLDDGGGE